MLAIEYILHPRDCRSDYPFVLPYLEIFDRLVEVKNMLRKIVMWSAWHNLGIWVVLKFDEYLGELAENDDVKRSCTEIKRIWSWFEQIRRVLQISRELSGKEQNNMQNAYPKGHHNAPLFLLLPNTTAWSANHF